MILNNRGIAEAIKTGEFKITEYSWEEKLESSNFELSSLKGGHKIRLHVGFLIRTLSDKKWINPKFIYNKRDGIIDLRKTDEHKYTLQPGESVILFTNEVVKIGSNHFGLLLSRVTLEENGLIVSPSYIDPNWEGVIQLIVTNNSETEQIIKEHCEIANLILLKMDDHADVTILQKNGHYGVSWETIRDNPAQPISWKDRKRSPMRRIRHELRTRWKLFTGLGFLGIAGLLYYVITITINFINLISNIPV